MTDTKRIEYIDALRGFTMLLVVYSHVSLFMLGMVGSSCFSYNKIISQFRMPLFFFISGFVFYKIGKEWNFGNFIEFCKKKVTVQILSPLIFMALYATVKNRAFAEMLLSPDKGGYWFTFALFYFFLLYISISSMLMGGGKYLGILRKFIILGISAILFFATQLISFEDTSFYDTANVLEWVHFKYFIFFVLGTFTKEYFQIFERCLDGKYLISSAIILFVLCQIVYFNCDNKMLTHAARFLSSVSGIAIVFSYFRHKKNVFSSDTRLGRTMIYVGRHTLDIYLMHFFFATFDCTKILNNFSINSNPLLEFTTAIILSAIVISFCLILSSVIRQSHALGKFLFGK